jgi:hypothetical protein
MGSLRARGRVLSGESVLHTLLKDLSHSIAACHLSHTSSVVGVQAAPWICRSYPADFLPGGQPGRDAADDLTAPRFLRSVQESRGLFGARIADPKFPADLAVCALLPGSARG